MRAFLLIVCVFLVCPLALGQASTGEDKDPKAKEELRKLHLDYNEAASKRDRAALERLFADGYVWVQGNGRVTTKAKHIENILGNTAQFSMPPPSFEQLTVYGDMAILRVTEREGLFATTIFAKRDGRWQFVHAQGTLLPPERKAIALDPTAFAAFVGSYEFGPGAVGDRHEGSRRPDVERRQTAEGQAGTALRHALLRRGERRGDDLPQG